MIEVDVRGFACPIPVVKTQKAMKENPKAELLVICEAAVSKENISRLALKKGYKIKETKDNEGYKLHLQP
ncbi:MAG: sulfurtransferase TusA family protein [Clostridia bacterium]|nr:sulfurtransferase TusA family protein [Clostridia bacterium]